MNGDVPALDVAIGGVAAGRDTCRAEVDAARGAAAGLGAGAGGSMKGINIMGAGAGAGTARADPDGCVGQPGPRVDRRRRVRSVGAAARRGWSSIARCSSGRVARCQ